MSESTFLQLKDHVGVTANGNLEPLVTIGVAVATPTMIENPETGKQEPGEVADTITITPAEQLTVFTPARIVLGTRIVEVTDERVRVALLQSQNWQQIDSPTSRDIAAAARALAPAAQEAGTHDEQAADATPADMTISVPDSPATEAPLDQPVDGEGPTPDNAQEA